MRIRVILGVIVCLSFACADTLTLRDGRTVEGQYLGGSARQIRMAVGDSVQSFDVSDVSSLQFEGVKQTSAGAPANPPAPPAEAVPPAPATPPPSEGVVSERKVLHVEPAATPAPPVSAAGVNQLPAGTAITIRMIDPVDSKTARTGQTFKASVDDAVMVGDAVAIPRGADVVTKLIEEKDPNKISGGGLLTLALDSVNLNGRMVSVNSQSVTTAGESRKGDSAKVIGGTAALGAIIGAIAGGGKGAAIGGVTGAGAGTAVRVLTKGSEVKIPSETRLTFTLQSPVDL